MDMQKLIIRPMEKGEEKIVAKVGRRAFQFIEALFVGTPRKAMVADYEGKIIGAIIYKFINTRQKQIIYIDEAFVDPDYHGMGVGKKLYTETFYYLQEWGCDAITALIKDDNVASWKSAMDNGFQRVSLAEAIKYLGLSGMIKQYFCTPMFIAVGMDFYLLCPKEKVATKKEQPSPWIPFLLGNLLLCLPMWLRLFSMHTAELLPYITAYLTILVIFMVTRVFGANLSGLDYCYRFNNCGGLLSSFLSYWGSLFPMNTNWYPVTYENTDSFRKKLALPELVKWGVFLLLPLLCFTSSVYLHAIAELCCIFLVFLIIPIYPFDTYGAGRIYRYKKGLWLMTFVISITQLMFISYFGN